MRLMICRCRASDCQKIYAIINEAARAYEGVIPPDRYHQPYMPLDELRAEMKRVTFYGWQKNGELIGVMGMEPVRDVTLIRHAYVLPAWQGQGIGTRLLDYLKSKVRTPRLLVGTWANAHRAVRFYQKQGFSLLADKERLLHVYWDIPERQVETSVVLGIELKLEVNKEDS